MSMVFSSLSNGPSLEIRGEDILTGGGGGVLRESWASYERSTFCGTKICFQKF